MNSNLNGIFGMNSSENTAFSKGNLHQQTQQIPQHHQNQIQNQYLNSKTNLNQNDFQNQLINVLNNNNNSKNYGSIDDHNLKHLVSNDQHQQQQATMFNDIGLLNMASVINLSSYLNSNNSSSSPSSSSSSASSTSSGTLLNSNSITSLNSNSNNGFNSNYNNLFSQQQQQPNQQHNWLLNNSISLNNGKQCTSCQEKPDSTCYCQDCKERLCHNCLLAHQRVRLTKDHRIHFFSVLDNGNNATPFDNSLLSMNNNTSSNLHHHQHQLNSSASTPPSSSSSTNGSSNSNQLSIGNVNRFMLPLSNSPDLLLSSSNRSNHSGLMGGMSNELDINISSQNGGGGSHGTNLISPHSHLINSSQAIATTTLNGQSNTSFIGSNSIFNSNESELLNGNYIPQIAGNQNALALQVNT